MTARMLEAVEGRPPTTTEGLSRALVRSRERNLALAEELTAVQAEDLAFAERVRVGADRIVAAAAIGARTAVVNEAGKLGYHASRRLRQLGGAA